MSSYFPTDYKPILDLYDTQAAISLIKNSFQDSLRAILNLKRVSAPLFVNPNDGLNDNLNGVERPVSFDIPAANCNAEVVHSLAKWKRYALYRYNFFPGRGLYTDMNAIRRDEIPDNLHSVYVDQWDWEKVITRDERNVDTLYATVQSIVECICHTQAIVRAKYPRIKTTLSSNVKFITAQELLDMYPDLDPKGRELEICRQYKTVFIQGIGGKLSDGKPHDGRAPDYDDWDLNGDILFYNEVLDCAFEVSSMGIRVDQESLTRQLELAGCPERKDLLFHRLLLDGTLPLTIGGGIGQSRLCMLMLGKAHIGEVQSSIWDKETEQAFRMAGVTLL